MVDKQVLIQRVGYGLLAIVILCALGLADAAIAQAAKDWAGPVGALLRSGNVICLTCLTVYLLAAREFTALLRQKGAQPYAGFAYLCVGLLIFSPWAASAGWMKAGGISEPLPAVVAVLVAALIAVTFLNVWQSRTEGSLRDVSATWAVIIYLGFFGSFSTTIRCGVPWADGEGVWLLIFLVLVIKVSDIGAFLVGSAIGRHKLIPKVSPGKSIEGTVAGLLASGLFVVLVMLALRAWNTEAGTPASKRLSFNSDGLDSDIYFLGALFGILVAGAAQFGDLIESCFKRDAVVKDSGFVMPRFGGMLDLIDSLIIALPVGWLLLAVVWPAISSLQ